MRDFRKVSPEEIEASSAKELAATTFVDIECPEDRVFMVDKAFLFKRAMTGKLLTSIKSEASKK